MTRKELGKVCAERAGKGKDLGQKQETKDSGQMKGIGMEDPTRHTRTCGGMDGRKDRPRCREELVVDEKIKKEARGGGVKNYWRR